jgi:hypothetical protein
MSDRTIKTKAQLLEMLAEAVRNTQPQPPRAAVQPDPIRDPESGPKRKVRPVAKRTTKAKNARASGKRKKARR